MIYNVLCEIREELSDIKEELCNVKEEVSRIKGVPEYGYNDLNDIYLKLEEIETNMFLSQNSL